MSADRTIMNLDYALAMLESTEIENENLNKALSAIKDEINELKQESDLDYDEGDW